MPDADPDWSFERDDLTFEPIPDSWVSSPTAIHHDEDAPASAVRLYAVSAALIHSRSLKVRYIHPKGTKVLELATTAVSDTGDGYYPRALTSGVGWECSYVPTRDQEPDDVARQVETRHLRRLWGDRVAEVPTDEATKRKIADGGRPLAGAFDSDGGEA